MKRRLILITCLLGIVGGSVGIASASPIEAKHHEVCIVTAQNGNYGNGQYLCLDTP